MREDHYTSEVRRRPGKKRERAENGTRHPAGREERTDSVDVGWQYTERDTLVALHILRGVHIKAVVGIQREEDVGGVRVDVIPHEPTTKVVEEGGLVQEHERA